MHWGDEEGAESSLQGRVEVSKESWRDEETAERQRGAFKERWGDKEGAESSLQGRVEASKERCRGNREAACKEESISTLISL
jgi:uncharacterized protein YjbJ (UPF0337 family)